MIDTIRRIWLFPMFFLALAAPSTLESADALSAKQRASVMEEVARQVRSYYVFPEKRDAIVMALDRARQARRYELDSPTAFADALTEDLQAASQDGHLGLRFDPAWYAEAVAAAGGAKGAAGAEVARRRQAARQHHGITEQRLLPGNVRYVKISGFAWYESETGAAYDSAMRFLRDGDAIVLDLRGNGGGDHAATRYLVSHFLDADMLLYTFHSQKEPSAESRTRDYLPAGRLKGKPLFVLVDRNVRSAGEDVAYQVQQFQLGVLVGEKTAGAANNNEHVPIAPGFLLSLSIGRPVHPRSQGNWEGVGIRPDVECPPAEALDRAHALALAGLAMGALEDPLNREEIAWAREMIEARLNPVSLPAARLRALTGRYGSVAVELRDGALWLLRPERTPARMMPMSDSMFAIVGRDDLRVRFSAVGLELEMLGAPEPRVFPRG